LYGIRNLGEPTWWICGEIVPLSSGRIRPIIVEKGTKRIRAGAGEDGADRRPIRLDGAGRKVYWEASNRLCPCQETQGDQNQLNYETLRTCVHPAGRFLCGLHKPSYCVANHRMTDAKGVLGHGPQGEPVDNEGNFPRGTVSVEDADGVYEVPNPLPFWGTTYILRVPADRFAGGGKTFCFRPSAPQDGDASRLMEALLGGSLRDDTGKAYCLGDLPRPCLLALAQTSRDPLLLEMLACLACDIERDPTGIPAGIRHSRQAQGGLTPIIRDHELFEVLGNNSALPTPLKQAMVLIPGIQGLSPIVGEYRAGEDCHVWEYLRANSYIPWGHFASNMAHDCVRYKAGELRPQDIRGLRHLYYQRMYSHMALGLALQSGSCPRSAREGTGQLSVQSLESLRQEVLEAVQARLQGGETLPFNSTLWGWNYGFDFSPTGYRLHASHQQIHNQFALIPPAVEAAPGNPDLPGSLPTYAVGDQVALFAYSYRKAYGVPFFKTYLNAIRTNRRLDGRTDRPSSLVVHEDDHCIVHIPKAQRSQGEVQIMTRAPVGHILEAGIAVRSSLDRSILFVTRALSTLGAEMVTCYEVSKRFDNPDADQRLLYCFLPRHPDSPGAFSERQERWITGHYPEDFAESLRGVIEA